MIVINQVKWGRHSGECDSPGHQLLLCIPWLFVLARIPLIRRQLITFVVKITKYLWSISDQIEEHFNWNLIIITISVSSKWLIQFIQIIGQPSLRVNGPKWKLGNSIPDWRWKLIWDPGMTLISSREISHTWLVCFGLSACCCRRSP